MGPFYLIDSKIPSRYHQLQDDPMYATKKKKTQLLILSHIILSFRIVILYLKTLDFTYITLKIT